jgi:hypothetical protein
VGKNPSIVDFLFFLTENRKNRQIFFFSKKGCSFFLKKRELFFIRNSKLNPVFLKKKTLVGYLFTEHPFMFFKLALDIVNIKFRVEKLTESEFQKKKINK